MRESVCQSAAVDLWYEAPVFLASTFTNGKYADPETKLRDGQKRANGQTAFATRNAGHDNLAKNKVSLNVNVRRPDGSLNSVVSDLARFFTTGAQRTQGLHRGFDI